MKKFLLSFLTFNVVMLSALGQSAQQGFADRYGISPSATPGKPNPVIQNRANQLRGGVAPIPSAPTRGTVATQEQLKRAQESMDLWGFKSDYMKFSDGRVVSIRRWALEKAGVEFPKLGRLPGKTITSASIYTRYKVLDSTDDGCRIEPSNVYGETDDDASDVFVENLAGYSGRMYGALLVGTSGRSFTYRTVTGASRVIPRVEAAVEATKEEWQEYLKKLTN